MQKIVYGQARCSTEVICNARGQPEIGLSNSTIYSSAVVWKNVRTDGLLIGLKAFNISTK